MFERKPADMTATLAEMERWSRDRTNFNQVEAKQKFAEYIKADRRFDGYDPAKLAERVNHCLSHGAKLDLDSPELRKGAPKETGWSNPPRSGYR